MQLLLDESVPAKLARLLPNHEPLLPCLEEELAGLRPKSYVLLRGET
jgi:hypothetical protein